MYKTWRKIARSVKYQLQCVNNIHAMSKEAQMRCGIHVIQRLIAFYWPWTCTFNPLAQSDCYWWCAVRVSTALRGCLRSWGKVSLVIILNTWKLLRCRISVIGAQRPFVHYSSLLEFMKNTLKISTV